LISQTSLLLEKGRMPRADAIKALGRFGIDADYLENYFDMAQTLE
jgi:hypothetical protein